MATKLCTHKENVNQINEIHLSKLPCEKKVFYASDSDNSMSAMIDKQVPVGETLELKKGAQVRIDKHLFTKSWKVALIILLFVYFKVMLAKNLNLSKGLVNGARGIVTQFDSGNAGYPVVKFMSGLEQVIGPEKWVVKAPGGGTITRRQLPLKLAWAVSIHKSQVKYVTVIKKFKLLSCKCISSNRQQQINISKKKTFSCRLCWLLYLKLPT